MATKHATLANALAAALTGLAAFGFSAPASSQKSPEAQEGVPGARRKVPETAPGGQSVRPAPEPPGANGGRDKTAKALGNQLPDTPEQRAKLLDDLYAHLAAAEDERAATEYTQAIMRLWAHSGSATTDLLVQRGLKLAGEKHYETARKVLDAAVELAPDYAEAWNARGQVFYLQNDYERALGDLRRTLALEPNHFKALEGIGAILREIGQKKGAFKAFEKLLQVHPFWPGAQQAYDELKRDVDGQGI